ncbi:hypothetical protein [Novosphingobium sp. THN1]|uniref:hypothetical protein n=1 Tax=Novosphingobium sp. THN1 TaxID=1016987 RepID=UPI001F0753C8|nr:hypothetical protein [Novosphingobium sp. THN1]
MKTTVEILSEDIVDRLPPDRHGPFVVGICGAQGSGKTWTTHLLAERMEHLGLRTVTLSLDDLYLTKADRQLLARNVHPLFAVRGVPGTHDIAAGIRIIDALGEAGCVALPAFDKAKDEPVAQSDWRRVDTPSTSSCSKAGASARGRSMPVCSRRPSTRWNGTKTRMRSGGAT